MTAEHDVREVSVIDERSAPSPADPGGAAWRVFTDRVMGGVSDATMGSEIVAGRWAVRLRGEVSLENNGGFVQMALDLATGSAGLDASAHAGIEIDVLGNGETYGCHLRTGAMTRPWQSYRQGFLAIDRWERLRLPFAGFRAHRFEGPLDLVRLRRLGLVAIGRVFTADLALARVALYRD